MSWFDDQHDPAVTYWREISRWMVAGLDNESVLFTDGIVMRRSKRDAYPVTAFTRHELPRLPEAGEVIPIAGDPPPGTDPAAAVLNVWNQAVAAATVPLTLVPATFTYDGFTCRLFLGPAGRRVWVDPCLLSLGPSHDHVYRTSPEDKSSVVVFSTVTEQPDLALMPLDIPAEDDPLLALLGALNIREEAHR